MTAGHRVVVTGVGLVTSLGSSAAATMSRLLAGERGFGEVSVFPVGAYPIKVAAEVSGLEAATSRVVPSGTIHWSRSDRLAVMAASEALVQAGLGLDRAEGELWVAASTGGMLETEVLLTRLFGQRGEVDPAELVCHPISAPADRIGGLFGPFARQVTVCSACSSGVMSLGLAAGRVRAGLASWALAGGVDALSRLTFSGFGALASLDPSPCRPFDRDRRGLSLGEGAAFLVLEREDSARERGATVLGEIGGWGVGSEAHHITQPEPDGRTPERVMRAALEDAGVSEDRVGYVSAHGTGTPLNDPMEAAAITRLLGSRMSEVPVSSQKGQIGHTLSAAGAVEAAITLLAMGEGVLPPNGGLENSDPAVPLRLVGPRAERGEASAALSSSFGFGGTDACIALTKVGVSSPRATGAHELVVTGVSASGPLGELEGVGCSVYADQAREADPAAGGDDPKARLDAQSSRRLDRAARQVVRLTQLALRSAGAEGGLDVGLVSGSAFGSGDEASAFLSRVEAKGPRFAPPLDFPNLVPSSPGAHAAIVAGLRGPVVSVADLGTTPLAALSVAVDLLRDERAGAMVATSSEPPARVVDSALSPACSGPAGGPRGHGGGAIVVETAERARARGARPLARLLGSWLWTDGASAPSIEAPRGRAEVLSVGDGAEARSIATSLGWGGAPLLAVGPRAGFHEASLALALSAAAARVASGQVDRVLVVGRSRGRAGAALLASP